MTHITCRLTVKNRDQLRNSTLGNRIWASFLDCVCAVCMPMGLVAWYNRLIDKTRTRSSYQLVVFKIAGLVHESLVGAAPAYLADDCRLLSDVGRRPLRSNSNDMRKLLVPRTHNKLGDRSFSAAGPRLWNDLPPGLRWPGLTFDSFRQSLKTHLFGDRSA